MTTGKRVYSAVVLTRPSDRYSTALMSAADTNEVMRSLKVDLSGVGGQLGRGSTAVEYWFEGARITGFSQQGGPGQSVDQVSVHFERLVTETGAFGSPAVARGGADAGTISGEPFKSPARLHSATWSIASSMDRHHKLGVMAPKLTITKDLAEDTGEIQRYFETNRTIPSLEVALGSAGPGQQGQPAPPATTMTLHNASIVSIDHRAGPAGPQEIVTLVTLPEGVEAQGPEGQQPLDAPAQMEIDHDGETWKVPVLDWNWGIVVPTDSESGLSTGRVRHESFNLTLQAGPSISRLINAVKSSVPLGAVYITPKSGPSYALSEVHLSDLQLQNRDQQQPTATVKLTYGGIAQAAGPTLAETRDTDSNAPGLTPKQPTG